MQTLSTRVIPGGQPSWGAGSATGGGVEERVAVARCPSLGATEVLVAAPVAGALTRACSAPLWALADRHPPEDSASATSAALGARLRSAPIATSGG